MALTTADAETLQREVRSYLDAVARAGDRERMAARIARKHSDGDRVVGVRRRGQEVLYYEERAGTPNELAIYDLDVDGTLLRVGTVWTGEDVEGWLEEYRYYLDWLAPEWERSDWLREG